RSDGVGTPSAAAHGDVAVVREEEDGTVVLAGKALGLTEVPGPADLVEAPILHGRLPVPNALLDPVGDVAVGRPLLLGGGSRYQGDESKDTGGQGHNGTPGGAGSSQHGITVPFCGKQASGRHAPAEQVGIYSAMISGRPTRSNRASVQE